MIQYQYPKEKELLLHYAHQSKDEQAIAIINKGTVSSSDEASHLSSFFWRFVDLTIADIDKKSTVLGESSLEEWTEIILQTLRSYVIASGYEKEWETESDKA